MSPTKSPTKDIWGRSERNYSIERKSTNWQHNQDMTYAVLLLFMWTKKDEVQCVMQLNVRIQQP